MCLVTYLYECDLVSQLVKVEVLVLCLRSKGYSNLYFGNFFRILNWDIDELDEFDFACG